MKKIPYKYTDFKDLIENNCYYVDKTMYIERLENNNDTIIYLRPRRFGKTLFTSMLNYYYDINEKDNFDYLFKDTYIYKHPTNQRNSYYVLRFDFSGINSIKTEDDIRINFNKAVKNSVDNFIRKYSLNLDVNYNQNASFIMDELLSKIRENYPIYILIDEYDNFTNNLLKEDAKTLKKILGKDDFIRDFYAILKKWNGLVIKKMFITGICSISLDSMTSGFNIGTNITNDYLYNAMTGITHDELKKLLNDLNIKENIIKIMEGNYDGYKFSPKANEKLFNPNLTMYFLNYYLIHNEMPDDLLDANIYLDYNQISNIVRIFNNNIYQDVIRNILENKFINGFLQSNFTLSETTFDENYLISLLYYFGYLTINGYSEGSRLNLEYVIPNKVIEKVFINYFMTMINKTPIDGNIINKISIDLDNGSINKLIEYANSILEKISNRDLERFDEKYIKLIYFAILTNVSMYYTYSEYEVNNGYIDLYVTGKNNYIFEFKYIKKNIYSEELLNKKELEAKNQLIKYSKDKRLNNTKKYIIIYSGKDIKKISEVKND